MGDGDLDNIGMAGDDDLDNIGMAGDSILEGGDFAVVGDFTDFNDGREYSLGSWRGDIAEINGDVLVDDLDGDGLKGFKNAVIGNDLTGFPLTNLPVFGFIIFPGGILFLLYLCNTLEYTGLFFIEE